MGDAPPKFNSKLFFRRAGLRLGHSRAVRRLDGPGRSKAVPGQGHQSSQGAQHKGQSAEDLEQAGAVRQGCKPQRDAHHCKESEADGVGAAVEEGRLLIQGQQQEHRRKQGNEYPDQDGVPGVLLIESHQPGQGRIGGQGGGSPDLEPGDAAVVVPPGDQGSDGARQAEQHRQPEGHGEHVVLGVDLPGLVLVHQLRHAGCGGEQKAHAAGGHHRHVAGAGAEKGLLRLLRRRAAPAQQQGQRTHQHRPDHQGQRGGGAVGKELGGRIIGGGILPQPQQESHRPARLGQDGQ